MREGIVQLLVSLQDKVPAREGCHHALIVLSHLRDDMDWSHELALQVFAGTDEYYLFVLDDAAFQRPKQEIVGKIVRFIGGSRAEACLAGD